MSDLPEVFFRVASDEDAERITGVLSALGYEVKRELPAAELRRRKQWAVQRMASRYRLHEAEAAALAGVLDGMNNDEIAEAQGISRATLKWRMHNVYCKTGTATREALLLRAMKL